MGTTSNLDLPYPEGTDLVIQGDDAIQALAEAVDAAIVPAYVRSNPASYVDQSIGSGVVVDWQTMSGSGHFTGTTVLTYVGPPRFFLITATVAVGTNAPSPATSTVDLSTDGGTTTLGKSLHHHSTSQGNISTHTVTALALLASGADLAVAAYITGNDGVISEAHFAAVSITPPTGA